jgi:hypothetical protein
MVYNGVSFGIPRGRIRMMLYFHVSPVHSGSDPQRRHKHGASLLASLSSPSPPEGCSERS